MSPGKPTPQQARNRLGAAVRNGADPATVDAARAELERAKLAADIRRVLRDHGDLLREIADTAPGLTPEQRAALSLLFDQDQS